jgi:hypothetical protein
MKNNIPRVGSKWRFNSGNISEGVCVRVTDIRLLGDYIIVHYGNWGRITKWRDSAYLAMFYRLFERVR